MYLAREESINIQATAFTTQSGSSGTVARAYIDTTQGWVSNHTGDNTAQVAYRWAQLNAPERCYKGVSVVSRVWRSGTLANFSISMYINGVVDSNINNYSINPANNTTMTDITASVGSTINPGDVVTFIVTSEVDTGEIARLIQVSLIYSRSMYE